MGVSDRTRSLPSRTAADTGPEESGRSGRSRPTGLTDMAAEDLAEQMARIVHELRSPLAATVQAVDLLAREPTSPPDPRLLAIAQRQLDAGMRRVEQLLVLLSDEADRTQLHPRPERLGELVHDVVDAHPATESHRVVVDVDPALGMVVDRDAFRHVLENLLSNAARHTPSGSGIEVGAVRRDDEAHLWVADEGPGVAAELRERIFEPFTRGSDGGAGLGLTIVRHFVEVQGGRVWHDDAYTRGTRIEVALPADEPPSAGD